LSTQNNIVPHFSHNNNIYIFPNLADAEYILINKKSPNSWPLKNEKELEKYIDMLKNNKRFENIKLPFIKEELNFDYKYKLITEKDSIILFKIIK
jgi:uncharacterized membrane protein